MPLELTVYQFKKYINWDMSVYEAIGCERFALASQLAVLRNCPDVLVKLLRSGGSLLLAAKVLIISRLLHKKASQRKKPPQYLENIKFRLASFRRKLLAKVDQVFQSPKATGEVLLEAMCAFSLATSSSPTDVLRHFHHVRLDTMEAQTQSITDVRLAMFRAFQIYVTTMQETREFFPRQLANALEILKSNPIIKSKDLYMLIELNLDLYEQWIGDDIKMFVPYIRHDELQKSEAERILKQWAKQAFSSFLGALKTVMQPTIDPTIVIQLRKDILQLWLSTPQQNVVIDSYEALEGLRNVFNSQANRLIQSQAMSLRSVGSVIDSTLLNWRDGNVDHCPSLWESSTMSVGVSDEENSFTQVLLARSKGESEALQIVSRSYEAWYRGVGQIEKIIKNMRETRWEDTMNDIENDDILEDKQALLSEDDPKFLHKELQISLETSLGQFDKFIQTQMVKYGESHNPEKFVYLLRVWREIRQHLPSSYGKTDIGIESIAKLQLSVVKYTIEAPLRAYERRVSRSAKKGQFLRRSLWGGDPKLPILPSLWVFRLLNDVVSSMKTIGSDIWSSNAVNILKNELRVGLVSYLSASKSSRSVTAQMDEHFFNDSDKPAPELEMSSSAIEKPTTNGKSQTSDDMQNHDGIQRAFDLLYLTHATKQKGELLDQGANDLVQLKDAIEEELGLEEGSKRRMRREAEDYWRRTSMLFALMA